MPKTIMPRWEWRMFGKSFPNTEAIIRQHQLGNQKASQETYLVSCSSNVNVKIREELLEVKILQSIDEHGLQQWAPAMKVKFPIPAGKAKQLFQYFAVGMPQFRRDSYSKQQFLSELVVPNRLLRTVQVIKRRDIYVIRQCIVEIVDTRFNTFPTHTLCIEHTDSGQVLSVLNELNLNLSQYKNIHYIQAIKQICAIPTFSSGVLLASPTL